MRILLELPSWLGDAVMASPSIENIINYYPDCKITFLGPIYVLGLYKYHPNKDRLVTLDKTNLSLHNQFRNLGEFDMFISYRSSLRTKMFKYSIRAQKRYQFNKRRFKLGHQVEKYNYFITSITGKVATPGKLKIYLNEKKSTTKNDLKIIGLNPGAFYGEAKCWPPSYFSSLAELLKDEYSFLIFGSENQYDLNHNIEKDFANYGIKNYENLTGKTTTEELVEQISKLDYFVTGDSGPMHIAASFAIPTISIFGPTIFDETSQWKAQNSVLLKENLSCMPCMKRVCPLGHNNCMKFVTPDKVVKALKGLSRKI